MKEYHEHFTEIWYCHVRCTNFFFENGDIDSLNELEENFQPLAKKLTSRPEAEYKHWKKLYQIYMDFHKLRIEAVNTPPMSWKPHVSLIDKLLRQIKKLIKIQLTKHKLEDNLQYILQSGYLKLLGCLTHH